MPHYSQSARQSADLQSMIASDFPFTNLKPGSVTTPGADWLLTSHTWAHFALTDLLEEREVDGRIRILLRIIDERGGVLHMSSKQIGSLLGLGEAHVLRLFNAEVGRTLRSHAREVRMAKAAELLKDCSIPIKTIASSCGYSVVCNFYRDFKIVYGISPMQMRLMKINFATPDVRPPDFGSARVSHLSKAADTDISNTYILVEN